MKKPLIGLVDTGTSNIKSVNYALKECGADVLQISNIDQNCNVDGIVVPGIGNFKFVMDKLKKEKLDKLILEKTNLNLPSLFICVGMQILFSESSEFGVSKGLGVFKGKVKKIANEIKGSKQKRNVPFIGWNKVIKMKNCKIFEKIPTNNFFYFTHSYYADPTDQSIISTKVNYFDLNYCSSVSKNNIFATQFHPEKSAKNGLKIYENFLNLL
tara:strand:- start:240 stop:878 length:639 start_codon:yes stop_codon:yes gene_type:complete